MSLLCSFLFRLAPHYKVKAYYGGENDRPNKAQSKTKLELFTDDSHCNGTEQVEGAYSN